MSAFRVYRVWGFRAFWGDLRFFWFGDSRFFGFGVEGSGFGDLGVSGLGI